jgi:hypothetical protein
MFDMHLHDQTDVMEVLELLVHTIMVVDGQALKGM